MNAIPRRAALLGAAGAALGACTAPSRVTAGSTVLLAYFSRAGENYFKGGRWRLRSATPRWWPA